MKSNLKISNESKTGLKEFRSFIELDRYYQTKDSLEYGSILIQTLFRSSKQKMFDKLKLCNFLVLCKQIM